MENIREVVPHLPVYELQQLVRQPDTADTVLPGHGDPSQNQ